MIEKAAQSSSPKKRVKKRLKTQRNKVIKSVQQSAQEQAKKIEQAYDDHQPSVELEEVDVIVPSLEPIKSKDAYFDYCERLTPDWRHRTAESILNLSTRKRWLSEDLECKTRKLFEYRETCNRVRAHVTEPRYADRMCARVDQTLYAACHIYEQPGDITRTMLEARILAGQTDKEISDVSAIPIDVVQAYGDYFFDVRDRLLARDWICSEVLGRVFQCGDAQWQQAMTAKYFAYFGGPHVLEAVMYGIDTSHGICSTADDLSSWADRAIRFKMKIQAAILTTTYSPSRFDMTDLMSGYISLASLENKERDLGGEENVLTKILETVKLQNPVLLGDQAKFTDFSHGHVHPAVIPRVTERSALKAGHVPEALRKYQDESFTPRIGHDSARKSSKKPEDKKPE